MEETSYLLIQTNNYLNTWNIKGFICLFSIVNISFNLGLIHWTGTRFYPEYIKYQSSGMNPHVNNICHFSLNFTTSGMLLQSILCLWLFQLSTWQLLHTGRKEDKQPQSALTHLSPERILQPNYYRLFKLWEIIHLRSITVSWLHDMKFYSDLQQLLWQCSQLLPQMH